ncbi:MAG: hypothetical protein J0M12_13225 [Deltaproteobacteria bacterium]|nr:hypothetical protein [Deltaproteobacteria bacterium]
MPLLGGDSNSFWRFDGAMIVKGFLFLLLLRGITILMGIYPSYIPIFDDCVNGILGALRWLSITFNRIASNHLSM